MFTPLFPPPAAIPRPTVYLYTFSISYLHTSSAVRHAFRSHRPHIAELPALNVSRLAPPPPEICASYSGLSPIVQEYVMADPKAHQMVAVGVEAVTRAAGAGLRECKMGVACKAGTHRSVAIAEQMALRLEERGFVVVVEHLHRREKAGDGVPGMRV
jgi:hypothetical protein